MFSIRKPTILETFKNKYNVILKEAWLDSCISQFTTNQNTSAPELLDTFVFSRFLDSRLSNSTNPSLDLSTKHFHILEIIDIQDVGISKFKLYTAIKLKNDARNQTTQINLLNNSIYAQKILNQASEIKRSGLQDGNLPGQGVHPGQGPQGHGQDQGNDDDFFEFGDENDKENNPQGYNPEFSKYHHYHYFSSPLPPFTFNPLDTVVNGLPRNMLKLVLSDGASQLVGLELNERNKNLDLHVCLPLGTKVLLKNPNTLAPSNIVVLDNESIELLGGCGYQNTTANEKILLDRLAQDLGIPTGNGAPNLQQSR